MELYCTHPTIKRPPESPEVSRRKSSREIWRFEWICNTINPDSIQCKAIGHSLIIDPSLGRYFPEERLSLTVFPGNDERMCRCRYSIHPSIHSFMSKPPINSSLFYFFQINSATRQEWIHLQPSSSYMEASNEHFRQIKSKDGEL